ncbi:MAG: hypothetical protein LBQ79_04605 [Deltaproteobacteria bacterium]|nr:hypothetical protein [Deltaproteobacteria bacterium]
MVVFKAKFDTLVDEVKSQLRTKADTVKGDTILIVTEISDDQTVADYALVTDFTLDDSKRDEWWHMSILLLTFPPANWCITLQTPHFTGQEIFTMKGRKVFIKALDTDASAGNDGEVPPEEPPDGPEDGGPGPEGPPTKPVFKLVH